MDTKETSVYQAVLIAASVIGTIILYFIISVIRQQRKHRLLYQAKLSAEIIALEKERTRVAADLHDELSPTLSAVKFKIENIDPHKNNAEQMISDSLKYIDSILHQVRHIAYGLMPITLIRNGLVPAIEEFIGHTTAGSKLNIEFQYRNIPELPQETSIHIYRILQEIIHNSIKHARATKLKIEIRYRQNILHIATTDNGQGFNITDSGNAGMGLNNIRSRTEMLAGELHIRSAPGKGTGFSIQVPLSTK